MDEVEYVLRIILKMNDQMAAVMAKARKELKGFTRDANSMNSAVTNLNQALANFDGKLDSVTKKLNDWRASLRDTDNEGKALAKTFDTVGKNADASTKKVGQAAKTTSELNNAANELRKQYEELAKVEKITDKNRDFMILKLKDIGRALDALAKKTEVDVFGKAWARWAKEARQGADNIVKAHNDTLAAEKEREKSLAALMDRTKVAGTTQKALANNIRELYNEYKKINQAEKDRTISQGYAVKAYERLGREMEGYFKKITLGTRESQRAFARMDTIKASIVEITKAQKDASDTQVAQQKADLAAKKAHEAEMEKIASNVRKLADKNEAAREAGAKKAAQAEITEMERVAASVQKVADKTARIREQAAIAEAQADVDRASAARERQEELVRLAERTAAIRERLAGTPTKPGEDRSRDIAELTDLQRSYRKLASDTNYAKDRQIEFGAEAERLGSTQRRLKQDNEAHSSSMAKLAGVFSNAGSSVAGFDNQMRGIGILAAVVSINELVSAAIALGGELVSLAGSAAMAGGALGGILAAGAAQALPVLGLLAGAASRVKGVMEAFEATQNVQKAQFTDAQKATEGAIDKTNALANAQDTATAANERLAEARRDLNQANKDGVQQLEDLIMAEKAAALAAKGASLTVKEAQEALQKAIASGADQLEIDRRRLAVDEAKLGKQRAGTTLRRATGERQAAGGDVGNLESVKNAAKAVQDAERSAASANRSMEQAQNRIEKTASTTATAAANLAWLRSQMAPSELALLDAVERVYKTYQRIFVGGQGEDGIYGVITNSFTKAVDEVNKIIQMPGVIKSITGLSTEIAASIDKIVAAVADPAMIEQLTTIIDQSTENLGPLTDILIDLGKAFLNIAETANPAFQKLIEYVGPVVDKLLELTGDKGKMEGFFVSGEEHLESWLDLVGAIIGLFSVLVGASAESGKTSIDDLTEKIKGWTDWLKENKKDVVGFFEDSREAAYKIGGVLEHLALVLFNTFTPERVDDFAKILNEVLIPAFEEVMGVVGDLTDKVAALLDNPVIADIAKWTVAFALLGGIANAIVGVFAKVLGPFAKFVGWLIEAEKKGGPVAKILGRIGSFGTKAIPFVGWGIAILELLNYFGLLDDAWDEIKQAAGALWGQIEPPLKRFMESFSRLIDAVKEGEGAFGVIMPVLREFLEIIVEVGGWLLEGLAKALGQVIGGIIDILGGLIDVITGILTGDFGLIWEGIKDILLGIANGLIGLIQLVFFRGLGRGLALLWGGIKAGLKALPGLIWDGLKLLPGLFSKAFKLAAEGGLWALKNLPKLIWEIAKDIVTFFWRGYRRLGQVLRDGIESGWKFLKGLPGRMWELAKDVVSFFWRGYRRLGRIMREAVEDAWGWLKKLPGRMWDLAKDVVSFFWRGYRRLGQLMRKGIEDAWGWIKGLPKRLGDIAVDAAKAFGNAFKDLGKAIIDGLTGGAKGAGQFALKLVGGIFTLLNNGWNKFLGGKEIGIGPAKFTIPKLNLHLAEGGPVPGSGSGDTVAALLTPGEHVLTKAEVAAAGGHGAIFALRKALGGGGQAIGGRYAVGGAAGTAGGLTITFQGGSLDDFASQWREFWANMRSEARRGSADIEKQFRDMRVNTARSADRMYRDVRGSVADIQNSFDVRGKVIVDTWSDNWLGLMKVTHEGLFYIGHETNKALKALGEKTITFGLTEPKKSDSGKAEGGWIGNKGERGRDRVRYALGRGEAVLNYAHQAYVEPAMNAFYGHGLSTMFGRVRGYHAGGPEQPGLAAGGHTEIDGTGKWAANPQLARVIASMMKRYKFAITAAGEGGHSANSDHHWGGALDLVPGTGGSWAMLDQLAKAAGWRPNQPMPGSGPFRWIGWNTESGHGAAPRPNAHLHLSWKRGGPFSGPGGAGAEIVEIGKLVVEGVGKLKDLAQASLDKVTKAANKKISEVEGAGETASSLPLGPGGAAEKVFDYFVGRGLSEEIAAGFVGTFQKESNFSTSVLNARGSGAQGLAQWLGGRLDILKSKPNWQSLQTQLDYVWEELHGPESKAFAAIKGAKSPAEAARIIDSMYERSDNILQAPEFAEAAYQRFAASKDHGPQRAAAGKAPEFAAGGEIGGPDGAPVNIIGHAGEWILNRVQQSKVARWLGTSVSAVRDAMGFSGGPTSFQGGGEVKGQIKRITARRTADVTDDSYQNVKQTLDDLRDLASSIRKVSKLTRASSRPILKLVELATKEGGLLEQLRGAIERQFTRRALDLRKAQFKVGPGRRVEKTGGDRGEIIAAEAELKEAQRQRGVLTDERRAIAANLKSITERQAKARKAGNLKLLKDLEAKEIDLKNNMADANERVQSNVEEIYAAQEAADKARADFIQAQVDAQQKVIDDIESKWSNAQAWNDRAKRIATALGNTTLIEKATDVQEANIRGNIEDLTAQLHQTRTLGYTDMAAQLENDIDELYTQIAELASQRLKDAADAIGKTASRKRTTADLFGRLADAIGVVGQGAAAVVPGGGVIGGFASQTRAQVAQARVDASTEEQAGYVRLRERAQAEGNVGMVEELTDKINELTVEIVENTKAARDAQFAATAEEFDYATTINDLKAQLITATGAVTGLTDSTELLKLANQRQKLLDDRSIELKAEYDRAVAEGDIKASRELEKALLQNQIAVQQNTAAVNELTGAGSEPSSFKSTPWEWLNIPLLTGTGQLNPIYTPPTTPMVDSTLGIGGGASTSTTASSTTINTEVTVNEAGQPVDPTKIASAVVFAQKTAQ